MLVVKFPSRGRRAQFLERMRQYTGMLSGKHRVHFLLTLDSDDPAVDKEVILPELRTIISAHKEYVSCAAVWGHSVNKVNAINRDLDQLESLPWSTLLLASDDMVPEIKGYDDIILSDMATHFPDTDGVLHYNDGYTRAALNSLAIMGRAYFERFGFIYNPIYSALFCDNELMNIAEHLGKQKYNPRVIIRHKHPCNTREVKPDAVYAVNEKFFKLDGDIYRARLLAGFGMGVKVKPVVVSAAERAERIAERRASRRADKAPARRVTRI